MWKHYNCYFNSSFKYQNSNKQKLILQKINYNYIICLNLLFLILSFFEAHMNSHFTLAPRWNFSVELKLVLIDFWPSHLATIAASGCASIVCDELSFVSTTRRLIQINAPLTSGINGIDYYTSGWLGACVFVCATSLISEWKCRWCDCHQSGTWYWITNHNHDRVWVTRTPPPPLSVCTSGTCCSSVNTQQH